VNELVAFRLTVGFFTRFSGEGLRSGPEVIGLSTLRS
jgi:hypothetical protein